MKGTVTIARHSKRLLAGILTIALMGLLAWSGIRRSRAPADRDEIRAMAANTADARIRSLLESAWEGDVPTYLDAFDGPIRQRLEREIDERGRAAFAADLRRAARSRKSHAVFAAESEGPDAARVTVETVYPDRNERQTYTLANRRGGWRVTDVEAVRGHEPQAKFGTPANYQAPEGIPVQPQGLAVETGEEIVTPQ